MKPRPGLSIIGKGRGVEAHESAAVLHVTLESILVFLPRGGIVQEQYDLVLLELISVQFGPVSAGHIGEAVLFGLFREPGVGLMYEVYVCGVVVAIVEGQHVEGVFG